MKTIQRAIQALACGLCAVAVAPTASAETQPGFYVGLTAGQSAYDLDKDELDAIIGLDSSTFDDSDMTLSIFAGYQFNPYIAVEVGHVDLGAAEYRSSGTVFAEQLDAAVDIESKGFTISGVGSLPLVDFFDLHGRIGFFIADTDLSVAATFDGFRESQSDSFDSNGLFFGVGGGFHLGEHWSLSLDWTRYDNVGDEDEDDDADTEAGFDIDVLSLSAMFRF